MGILAALLLWTILALSNGCGDIAVKPGETPTAQTIILHAGSPAVIQKNVSLPCKLLKDPTSPSVDYDVGGWITMPPEHWEYLRTEVIRLRKKCGESSSDSVTNMAAHTSISTTGQPFK